MKKCVVVIPIHSPTPTTYELMSLEQCYSVLGKHDIRIIAPKGLDVSEYRRINSGANIIFIDPKWQAGIEGYNRLKRSSFFYSLFLEYQYLLTYELDAYVFNDELEEWCSKGYTFIGAPLFKQSIGSGLAPHIEWVGNGGFSLRNVQIGSKCAQRIEGFNRFFFLIKVFISLGHRIGKKKAFEKVLSRLLNIKGIDSFLYFSRIGHVHEEFFFVFCFGATFKDVIVAPAKEAIKFSFEMYPAALLEMNEGRLPFGCHAYLKYDKAFWAPYFQKNGHNLDR